jgi:DNA end-binding protein Ku
MAAPQWKGHLKLSLVSVPFKAYGVNTDQGTIRFNQLHAECKSRIKYTKTCPIHGEVPNDEIVSGYEHDKGQYAVVDEDELDKLRTEDEKSLRIDSFVRSDAIDPVYYSGKNYFLLPDGKVGADAYRVIYQGMVDAKRHAVAHVVMHGRDHLVLLRPQDGLLAMSVLNFPERIASPAAFAPEAPTAKVTPEESKLSQALIEAGTHDLDMAKYKDVYTERLSTLIEAKVAGQEVVSPPPAEPQQAQIINLMDALRKSVHEMEGKTPGEAETEEAKPKRKMAASKGAKPAARKRKSS